MGIFEFMSQLTNWFLYTSSWYILLFIIGAVFWPMARLLFPKFYDQGYGLAKAIGILLISYVSFTLGSFKILPFNQFTIFLIFALFGIGNFFILKKVKHKKAPMHFLALEEALFIIAFFAWSYIRAQEPSIRGLEKFMDFGFINAAMRGDYFPTKDMWLAGKSINYYYFGHITGAVLTKMYFIPSYISYNLILAQIFALSIVSGFSVAFSIAYTTFQKNLKLSYISAFLSTFLMNLAGNLHTIYAFFTTYDSESPVPFWKLESKFTGLSKIGELLDKLPHGYWYPNATRFIPYTIHEFPLYSYVVADLHGHVFDIPFVVITFALLYSMFIRTKIENLDITVKTRSVHKAWKALLKDLSLKKGTLSYVLILSFMISIHYMTNAFDAPIYIALTGFILLTMFGFTLRTFIYGGVLIAGFILFNVPFSMGFEPFATGVGFNCMTPAITALGQSLTTEFGLDKKFLFENNCQRSTWWMLLTLWGFFWFNFIWLILYTIRKKFEVRKTILFMLIVFSYSTMIILASEIVYAKDIYPSHFRANTMFKLGYQAFIMMALGSGFMFTLFKSELLKTWRSKIYMAMFIPLFTLVAIYPTFAVESYYGGKDNGPYLNGNVWLQNSYPEYYEIINYFNENVEGQPTILEANGDSYTDYNVVSSYTGLPTVGGWYVHEWLWRGDSEAVGALTDDIARIYESNDIAETQQLLKKFKVEYVVIGSNEKEKFALLDETKFEALGQPVFTSNTGDGKIFKIPVDTY